MLAAAEHTTHEMPLREHVLHGPNSIVALHRHRDGALHTRTERLRPTSPRRN
eukprot:COSAG03_NODE_24756_length_270_cov_0.602339_1_plen_51_part_10